MSAAKQAEDQLKRIRSEIARRRRELAALKRAIETGLAQFTKLMSDTNPATSRYPAPPAGTIAASLDGHGLPTASGVYFLWRGGSIVYVGQAVVLSNRVRLRNHQKLTCGDLISYLLFPEAELNFAEYFYIGLFRPARNFGSTRDAPLSSPPQVNRKHQLRQPSHATGTASAHPGYLTLEEIADRHGRSKDATRSWLAKFKVPIFRPSERMLLISLVDLDAAERRCTRPDSDPLVGILHAMPKTR